MSNGTDKTINQRRTLEEAIAERTAKLEAARRHVASLEGEIHAYQLILKTVFCIGGEPQTDRRAHLSPSWAKILRFMHDMHPSGASVDVIMSYVADHALGISRPAVRSQLSLYAGKGIVERLDAGLYAVPVATIERLEEQEPEKD